MDYAFPPDAYLSISLRLRQTSSRSATRCGCCRWKLGSSEARKLGSSEARKLM